MTATAILAGIECNEEIEVQTSQGYFQGYYYHDTETLMSKSEMGSGIWVDPNDVISIYWQRNV